VSYKSRSPELALKWPSDLTSLYLNAKPDLAHPIGRADLRVLCQEAERQQAKIAELDKALSVFKQKNQDRLPSCRSSISRSASARKWICVKRKVGSRRWIRKRCCCKHSSRQIPDLPGHVDTGQRMLSAAEPTQGSEVSTRRIQGRYAPDHPDIITTQREVEGLEKEVQSDDTTGDLLRQLNKAREQLASAKEKYAPEHPDVVRLTRSVASLKRRLQRRPPRQRCRQSRNHPDNPAYIQVQGQLDAVTVERESAVAAP